MTSINGIYSAMIFFTSTCKVTGALLQEAMKERERSTTLAGGLQGQLAGGLRGAVLFSVLACGTWALARASSCYSLVGATVRDVARLAADGPGAHADALRHTSCYTVR